MSQSLFRPFADNERPFSASKRAFTGVSNNRLPIEKQDPGNTTMGAAADAISQLNEGAKWIAELYRNKEIASVKEQVENQLPKGTEADLTVGGYSFFGNGMDYGFVSGPNLPGISATDLGIMRPSTVSVQGKAPTTRMPTTITVQTQSGGTLTIPVGPTVNTPGQPPPVNTPAPGATPPPSPPQNQTRSVDDRPSVVDRLDRGERVTIDRDPMTRPERDFFDKGRMWA